MGDKIAGKDQAEATDNNSNKTFQIAHVCTLLVSLLIIDWIVEKSKWQAVRNKQSAVNRCFYHSSPKARQQNTCRRLLPI
jgi:hypothetical protein